MRIDYAIHASDDNPLYLDFWEPVSKIWQLKFNITPVLLYFGDGSPSTTYGKVVKMDRLEGYPLAMQCQWSRFWYATTLFTDVGIISDIDMFPLSKFYFVDQLKDIKDKYVHLNPCFDTYPHIAACYHVATGTNFKKVLGAYDSFKESMEIMTKTVVGKEWYFDELFSTYKIKSYKNQDLFHYIPRDGGQNGHRIDRPTWHWKPELLKQDWYYDAHCPRPYGTYKEELDKIVEMTIFETT